MHARRDGSPVALGASRLVVSTVETRCDAVVGVVTGNDRLTVGFDAVAHAECGSRRTHAMGYVGWLTVDT